MKQFQRFQYFLETKMRKTGTALLLFISSLRLAECGHLIGQSGTYCDSWTQCGSNYQCIDKQCATLNCSQSSACDEGFSCSGGKCIPNQHVKGSSAYCDEWTKCFGSEQCFNKACIPSDCIADTNCIEGFQCREAKCIQIQQQEEQSESESSEVESASGQSGEQQSEIAIPATAK